MTTFFVGGELDTLVPSRIQAVESAEYAQDGYSRGGVSVSGTLENYAECRPIVPATGARTELRRFWFHALPTAQWTTDGERTWIEFRATDGTPVVRLSVSQGFPLRARLGYWTGSAWTTLNPSTALTDTAELDIRIDLDAGEIELLTNQRNAASFKDLPLAGLKSIGAVRLHHVYDTESFTLWQQVIIADYQTVGHKVRRVVPVANSTPASWTGNASRIADFPDSTSTILSTSTADAVHAVTGTQVPALPEGHAIKAVALGARARITGTDAVKTFRTFLGTAGGRHESPTHSPATGYGPHMAIWDANPATGQPWGSNPAAVNAPFGVRAL